VVVERADLIISIFTNKKTLNMNKQERIKNILKDHKNAIEAQIKKGFTSGSVLGYFKWQVTENGLEIQLLN
jgi:hypothetical protein